MPPIEPENQNAGSQPPPLPHAARQGAVSARSLASLFLSLGLIVFLGYAVFAALDDLSIVFLQHHWLSTVRGYLLPVTVLVAFMAYCLMGLTPLIPKRRFLPLVLLLPVSALLVIPFLIYTFDWVPRVSLAFSIGQLIVTLAVIHGVQHGWKLRWPLVPESELGFRVFSWRNLITFVSVNVFVLLPVLAVYLGVWASVAVDHFSDGFIALRPKGLIVETRRYTRNDGKTVRLVPMSHIGNSEFYQTLSQSFPTNATVLMEGVSDEHNLLTNKITYKRVAESLGVAEQQKEFKPRGRVVRADVDVEEFTTNTIDFINLAMLFHSKGLTSETVTKLTEYSEPEGFEEELLNDLLRKRNRHVLKEIERELAESDTIIVPWGAAHMPGIGRELVKMGFRVVEAEKHVAIRF